MNLTQMLSYFSRSILCLGILLTLLLDVFVYVELEHSGQKQMEEMGDAHLAWISQSVERYVNISNGMVSYVMRNYDKPIEMEKLAGQYFPLSPELRSIQLAPGGIVTKIYPWEKDRLDVYSIVPDKKMWEEDMSLRRKRTSFAAIVDRDNGEKDMIFIRPVYIWKNHHENHFWGFTITDVSVTRMLEHLDLRHLSAIGVRYQLYWQDNERKPQVLIDSNGQLSGDTVKVSRGVDGDIWTLYMQPIHGWGNMWIILLLTWVGLTTTGLLSFYRGRIHSIRKEGEVDSLTGVFNRKGGHRAAVDYFSSKKDRKAMVIAMDVDDFKLVNDVYGHEAGDQVLKQLVSDVKNIFGVPLIITRHGGDEFIIIKSYEEEPRLVEQLRLFSRTRHEVIHKGKKVEFHCSMGYALYPIQGINYKNLCSKADFALYNSKLNGKGGWRKFDDSLFDMQERFQLGFNLADMTNHMAGAMIVYRSDEERKILFASDQVINLFECKNWQDFMNYSGGSFNHLISADVKQYLDTERPYVIAYSDEESHIEVLEYQVMTKKGKLRDIISAGHYHRNAFHGGVFYVTLFVKEHMRIEKRK